MAINCAVSMNAIMKRQPFMLRQKTSIQALATFTADLSQLCLFVADSLWQRITSLGNDARLH